MKRHDYFITGTDTGVGKTRVSAALLYAWAQAGLRTAGYKPVAAGMNEALGANEDTHDLQAASSVPLSFDEITPYAFHTACAPHIAATLENRAVDKTRVLQQAQQLTQQSDALIVEGVGGFRVPLTADWDSADLAQDLGLPVILVVGMRLGCLNHAVLSVEAIQARGLHLAGWIGNTIDPQMMHFSRNVSTLRELLKGVPCLGIIPELPSCAPPFVAAHLDLSLLS
jgi:dethiobiotin synthetase